MLTLKQIEKIAKAFSDINRLKTLKDVQSNEGKLECSMIISVLDHLAQPSVSHHIKNW